MHQMVSSGECGSSPSSPAPPSSSPAPDSPLHVTTTTHYQRPSSLHGLKHKLGTGSEVRRGSLQHMPLSPLARTPSPSPQPQPQPQPASPTRLHPRSAESKCSISPLCCGGVGVAGTGSRRGVVWRASAAPAPPTPPPVQEKQQDEPPLPRIAEEKDSPTHHARNLPIRSPVRQAAPSIFTSSPKTSLDKYSFDASVSFTSLSLSDESYVADTSADMSQNLFVDDSRTSTEENGTEEKIKKPITQELLPAIEIQPSRKKSDSSLKDEDLKSKQKKDKPELKKQDSMLKKVEPKEEKLPEVKAEEKKVEKTMERSGSIKKVEKDKESKKQEKADKKQEKSEAKRADSMKKNEGLKRQDSIDVFKQSPEPVDGSMGAGEVRSKNSMVSKLLGVMGRKGTKDRDDEDHKVAKKNEKNAKKKSASVPPQPQAALKENPPPAVIEREVEDKKRKGRGRASSSSSGEK